MRHVTVNRWIVCVSGAWQSEGQITGMDELVDRIHNKCVDEKTRVILRPWTVDPNEIAKRISNHRPPNRLPHVVLIGYSAGGCTANRIAGKLRRYKIDVDVMVLSDAIWHPFTTPILWRLFPFLLVLSLLNLWTIRIHKNVRRVFTFRQKKDIPRGSDVRPIDGSATLWSDKTVLHTAHRYMDELPEFVDIAMLKACPSECQL